MAELVDAQAAVVYEGIWKRIRGLGISIAYADQPTRSDAVRWLKARIVMLQQSVDDIVAFEERLLRDELRAAQAGLQDALVRESMLEAHLDELTRPPVQPTFETPSL